MHAGSRRANSPACPHTPTPPLLPLISADWLGLGVGGGGSPCHLGVPHHHVSIRVLGDAAFLRVEVEDFRCVAAGDGHKSILVHFAAVLQGGEDGGEGKQSSGFELKRPASSRQQNKALAEQRSTLDRAVGNAFPLSISPDV